MERAHPFTRQGLSSANGDDNNDGESNKSECGVDKRSYLDRLKLEQASRSYSQAVARWPTSCAENKVAQ